MKRYYLIALANFVAAVGCGVVLRSGIRAFDDSTVEGPVLAFFVGALLGLLIRRLVPRRSARRLAPWFSLGAGLTSLALFWLVKDYEASAPLPRQTALLALAFLSLRFGLWFFPRALRAQTGGGKEQGISLVELGYYAGAAFGLAVWKTPVEMMAGALLLDAMLQTLAGLTDFAANAQPADEAPAATQAGAAHSPAGGAADAGLPFDYGRSRRMCAAVIFLTVGFQAVPFGVAEWGEGGRNVHILTCFYVGVALSALLCQAFRLKLDWDSVGVRLAGGATISSEVEGSRLRVGFGVILLAAAASLVAALLSIGAGSGPPPLGLAFVAASSFTYQILVLSLLDRIGRDEKRAGLNSMITDTYLLVAVGTVFTIGALHFLKQNYVACAALTIACSLAAHAAVRRRPAVAQPSSVAA